jgi:hypothetical protein
LDERSNVVVDYNEMVRQCDMCEIENRVGKCACDSCPVLDGCRKMFDSHCPLTAVDDEVFLTNRPVCHGRPMKKDGHAKSGQYYVQVYRCSVCKSRRFNVV